MTCSWSYGTKLTKIPNSKKASGEQLSQCCFNFAIGLDAMCFYERLLLLCNREAMYTGRS
jgi:hypothetical protein